MSLPQQNTLIGLTPIKRQPTAQHGQKAAETQPVAPPSRSFNPRPGH
jgi:hypothetical protein